MGSKLTSVIIASAAFTIGILAANFITAKVPFFNK